MSAGATAGVVIAVLVVVGAGVFCFIRRRRGARTCAQPRHRCALTHVRTFSGGAEAGPAAARGRRVCVHVTARTQAIRNHYFRGGQATHARAHAARCSPPGSNCASSITHSSASS
jgi:hypothetical protein